MECFFFCFVFSIMDIWQEENKTPSESQFFTEQTPFLKGTKTISTELCPLKVYQFSLRHRITGCLFGPNTELLY